ncbi:MAG TPA: hypothetical protein PLT76_08490 [Candidatus Omnitrophota bacterium]|nr:hypothetical protein [Candidatus Omnitrophota bacterium]HQO58739.1 hypothetical protein [Candidatus Omnitrophota bacterium]
MDNYALGWLANRLAADPAAVFPPSIPWPGRSPRFPHRFPV